MVCGCCLMPLAEPCELKAEHRLSGHARLPAKVRRELTTNAVLYATTFGSAVAGADNFIQQDISYNRRNICAAQVSIGENRNLQGRAAGTCCASQAISQRLAGDLPATLAALPHLFSLGDTERQTTASTAGKWNTIAGFDKLQLTELQADAIFQL